MEGSVFGATDLRRANFHGANMENAMLTKGVLWDADLSGANPTGALADRVTLDNANLSNAIVRDATMTRTRFYGATITGRISLMLLLSNGRVPCSVV